MEYYPEKAFTFLEKKKKVAEATPFPILLP